MDGGVKRKISPDELRRPETTGGESQATYQSKVPYANMILDQLAHMNDPIVTKSTTTGTVTGTEQPLDTSTLGMLLYFMLGDKGKNNQGGGWSLMDLLRFIIPSGTGPMLPKG